MQVTAADEIIFPTSIENATIGQTEEDISWRSIRTRDVSGRLLTGTMSA